MHVTQVLVVVRGFVVAAEGLAAAAHYRGELLV
jgi:hypothetical protein